MSNLKLYTNQAVPQEARKRLARGLKRVLPVSEATVIHQKAEGVKSIVQLALEASEWVTPLRAAATYFLYQVGKGVANFSGQIGKRAADAAIDRWVEEKDAPGHNSDDTPLRGAAKVLSDVAKATEDRTLVRIGLPIPDDFMACCIQLEDPNEDEVALAISLLVLQAEEIERIMKNAEQDYGIFGPVELKLREDGRFEARWKDEEFNEHQFIVGEAP